ncbi:MAG: recombination protein NinG [Bacteroidota bacterium]
MMKPNPKVRKIKFRKCKVCNDQFEVNPHKPLIPVCGINCAIDYQRLLKLNKEAKESRDKTKAMKEGLLTHSDYIKMLQVVFNAFIRKRDSHLPCITCQTEKNIEYAAGHFYPTTYQYLRFNEDNVHKQCNKSCNMMKRGNLLEYRPALIKKIGIERVEVLDNTRHLNLDLSIPEIKEQIIIYKLKLKQV